MNKTPLALAIIGTLALQPLSVFAEDKPAAPAATPAPTPNPDPYANETKAERDARMAWWRDARFGMFIHWGVYAVPAGFHKGKPIGGLGAKHHDGFALWPSAASDWDIEATPYKKDLLKPLAEACKKHGIKLGFYYSQAKDWINDGASTPNPKPSRTMDQYIDEIAVPQMRELLTNYGDAPVIIWWDFPTAMNEERAAKLIDLLKLKPSIIHNNRLLKIAPYGKVDMEKIKSGKREPYSGDTETPEQHIPATGFGERDWEACMTINDTWGFKSNDHNWKSSKTLIQHLIDIASKGGNYLLNVGPTAEGLIPEPSVERLEDIGKWMTVNSESIYGTQASPFPKLAWGRCTQKKHDNGTTLYLHVFERPADRKLLVPGLENQVESAALLANNEKLEFKKTPKGVELQVPTKALDPNATVIKLEILGEPKVTALK